MFSISKVKIGCAKNSQFDINNRVNTPVSIPLRRVPLHKEEIVHELIKKYEDFGLVETIDSPFRAATVLVEKKNCGNSDVITDKYRLCVDYRSLNQQIIDSAWPTPSIDYCLDAAVGSIYLT